MSLLGRFIEPTKDYINFKDLLINLSGMNNRPLYEIVNYLLCCDLNKLGLYYIDPKYRITPISFDKKNIMNQALNVIKEVIRLGDINDEHWIYSNDDSLELFSHGSGEKIAEIIKSQVNFYFNKEELSNFDSLNYLLHLDVDNGAPMPNDNERIIKMQERINELLDELADKDDFIKAPLSKINRNEINEQPIKETITSKEEYENLTPIQKHTFRLKSIVLPLAQKIWLLDRETNLLMRTQVARLIVELLPDFNLTENQVNDWLKHSVLVPQAIIDRCTQNDYGNSKPEKVQREVIESKIRKKLAPEIQYLIENTPKF